MEMKKLTSRILIIILLGVATKSIAKSDCKVRDQELLPSTYTGACLNGYAHGHGVAVHDDRAIIFTGNFKVGIPNGQGKYEFVDKKGQKSVFLGNYVNGKLSGKGRANLANGDTYSGLYHLDKKHGYGIYQAKGNYVFKGNYRNGNRHGAGQQFFDDGASIIGQWVNGKLNGYATSKLANGSIYKGNYINGWRNGKGSLRHSDGETVTGQWKDGSLNGYAIRKYTNGTVFKGNFHKGKRHGKGHIRLASGSAANGVWTNGKLTSGEALKLLSKISNKPKIATRKVQPTLAPRASASVIESRIDGDFEGWEGETIFKLMNGQIWQQSDYKYNYRYAFMPEVLIYRSGGGYKMKVDGISDSIRVIRLK